ncbi:hypothetical protein FO519_008051 [Halicephalobus sp. NKZ332]|nr:hypothetical protein FO519_008051 [Halicephalobus sp. NKZ332]
MFNTRNFHIFNDYISGVLGLTLNTLLIFLIRYTKNIELKKYNQILLQSVLIDIYLVFITFITKPIIVAYNHRAFVMINTVIPVDQTVSFVLYIFWVGSVGFSMGGVSILFYFRYRTLCLGRTLSVKMQLACLFFAAIGASFLPLSYCYSYYYFNLEKLKISEELAPYFMKYDGKVDAIFIIDTRPQYHEVQSQITKSLVAQAVIPLLIVPLPVLLLFVSTYAPLKIDPKFSSISILILGYLPTMNALSILIFVKAYKIVIPYNGSLFYLVNTIFPMSDTYSLLVLQLNMAALAFSMGSLSTLYYFRYKVLVRNEGFTLRRQANCLMVVGIGAFVVFLAYLYAYLNLDESVLESAEFLKSYFGGDDGEVGAILVLKSSECYLYILMASVSIFSSITYNIVFWCGWRIYKFLRNHKNSTSANTYFLEIQTQITKTLVAQAVIPVITLTGPYTFLLINLFVPGNILKPEISSLSVLLFSFLPIGNAFSILLFVKPCRKQGWKLIKGILRHGREKGTSVHYISSQGN